MSSHSIVSLRARKVAVDARLRAVGAELRSSFATSQAARAAWTLPQRARSIALIIYTFTGCAAEPAVKFLKTYGKMRRWPCRGYIELAKLLEDAFMAADADELAHLTDIAQPSNAVALRCAMSYVDQWLLVVWARDLNESNGVAPSTDLALSQRREHADALRCEAWAPIVGTAASSSARKWASRWRKRWGGKFANISVRDHTPVNELQDKACVFCRRKQRYPRAFDLSNC